MAEPLLKYLPAHHSYNFSVFIFLPMLDLLCVYHSKRNSGVKVSFLLANHSFMSSAIRRRLNNSIGSCIFEINQFLTGILFMRILKKYDNISVHKQVQAEFIKGEENKG